MKKMEMQLDLAEKVKLVRLGMDVTQKELARRLGYINQTQISKIENGKRKITLADAFNLARELKIPVESLLK